MRNRTSEKGSAHVVIAVVLVVIILGLLGYIFFTRLSANKDSSKTKDQTQSTTDDASKNDNKLSKNYTSPVGDFTINYPSDWQLSKNVDQNSDFPTDQSTLTSPNGTVLTVGSNSGGIGGSCTPNEGDVPFQAGNACPSSEFLSAERLNINNVYSKSTGTLEKEDIYLVTRHFSKADGTSTYSVGAGSFSKEPDLDAPYMGFAVDMLSVSNTDANGKYKPNILVYAVGDSKSFLQSSDVATIKQIIRSLVVNN